MSDARGGSKLTRELVKKLRKAGYTVTTDSPGRANTNGGRRRGGAGSGHLRVLDENGNFISLLPNTPKNENSIKATIGQLRRRGVEI